MEPAQMMVLLAACGAAAFVVRAALRRRLARGYGVSAEIAGLAIGALIGVVCGALAAWAVAAGAGN